MENFVQKFVDLSSNLNERTALIVSFIQFFTNLYCYVCVFRNTNIVHFTPEGSTGGLHQGFVGYLYKAQISQYAVLVVIELLTAIIVEHNWMIQV